MVISLLEKEYGVPEWRSRRDPLSELIYTILSQNTSDANSTRAFQQLWSRFNRDWEAIAGADVNSVANAIQIGGLHQVKAPRIQAILRAIREEQGGYDLTVLADMPTEQARAWLRRLPGVGPKSAACVLMFSLVRPALPVDTHVYRVARRLGLIGPKVGREQAHEVLESMVPAEKVLSFHVNLVRHGRKICKAPTPLCHLCVLNQGCPTGRSILGLTGPLPY
ncbi:MAG: endonuclease III [Chloroflexi bacterium]|nr:endonuclease III [Chloroflexota bacterium]